ncbi:MAG: thiamine-phosphate kinase [Hyphomicrobiales bacterium]
MQDIGEFDLIARYLKPLATNPGAFNLLDDSAVLSVPDGATLIMSKDVLVGNVHFFPDDLPDLIARKALRTNVSDIISKGADPAYYALGLSFPNRADAAFMEAFAQGLEADQDFYGISLLGGDTTRSLHDFMISVTMFGFAAEEGPVTRMGANAGEALYVSGTLGDSALGLLSLKEPDLFEGASDSLMSGLAAAYLLPQPPIGLQSIIAQYASASMDISDGILTDSAHMCRASGVSARIQQDCLPFSETVKAILELNPVLLDAVVKGGDDYQCLMSIPIENEQQFIDACLDNESKVTRVGEMSQSAKGLVRLYEDDKKSKIKIEGYTHF